MCKLVCVLSKLGPVVCCLYDNPYRVVCVYLARARFLNGALCEQWLSAPPSLTRWSRLMTKFVYCVFQEAMRNDIPVDAPETAQVWPVMSDSVNTSAGDGEENKHFVGEFHIAVFHSFNPTSCPPFFFFTAQSSMMHCMFFFNYRLTT